MIDSRTGVIVVALVWLGGAAGLAAVGAWKNYDRRFVWAALIWLLVIGWAIAGEVTGWVLDR